MPSKIDQPAECDNCLEPVTKCECGKCETLECDAGPICPFCGHLNKACDSDGLLYSESVDEYDCGECSKTFNVSVGISFSWSASRKDND